MNSDKSVPRIVLSVLLTFVLVGALPAADSQSSTTGVRVVRLPAGGIQPQVAVDARGGAHVVYFSGESANGDLLYATVNDAGQFSPPTRVNTEPGSAIATGTVRGAQVAVGTNGRVHVAWNGSRRAIPRGPGGATPMLYARLDPGRRAFEPQRNVLQFAVGLDGGGAIAADDSGRVLVAWHAGGPEAKGEGDRRVWMATSVNDGETFSKEQPVSESSTGACGCCGMDALIDRRGSLYILYRSARDVVHRDTYLLRSTDGGRRFSSTTLQEWRIGACPMSTFALAESANGVYAAWETNGQVQFTRVDRTMPGAVVPTEAPGAAGKRRHPSLATNARGEILLAWSEGTGWQKGGAVAWQVFNQDGRVTSLSGRSEGMPVWGFAAAYTRRDGGFTIVY
jgi:hypothetical protein